MWNEAIPLCCFLLPTHAHRTTCIDWSGVRLGERCEQVGASDKGSSVTGHLSSPQSLLCSMVCAGLEPPTRWLPSQAEPKYYILLLACPQIKYLYWVGSGVNWLGQVQTIILTISAERRLFFFTVVLMIYNTLFFDIASMFFFLTGNDAVKW